MRKIIAYKHYFKDFVRTLSKEEQNKIRRVLDLFNTEVAEQRDRESITIKRRVLWN